MTTIGVQERMGTEMADEVPASPPPLGMSEEEEEEEEMFQVKVPEVTISRPESKVGDGRGSPGRAEVRAIDDEERKKDVEEKGPVSQIEEVEREEKEGKDEKERELKLKSEGEREKENAKEEEEEEEIEPHFDSTASSMEELIAAVRQEMSTTQKAILRRYIPRMRRVVVEGVLRGHKSEYISSELREMEPLRYDTCTRAYASPFTVTEAALIERDVWRATVTEKGKDRESEMETEAEREADWKESERERRGVDAIDTHMASLLSTVCVSGGDLPTSPLSPSSPRSPLVSLSASSPRGRPFSLSFSPQCSSQRKRSTEERERERERERNTERERKQMSSSSGSKKYISNMFGATVRVDQRGELVTKKGKRKTKRESEKSLSLSLSQTHKGFTSTRPLSLSHTYSPRRTSRRCSPSLSPAPSPSPSPNLIDQTSTCASVLMTAYKQGMTTPRDLTRSVFPSKKATKTKLEKELADFKQGLHF